MSNVSLLILIFVFLSLVFARPSPAIIYSAIIYNRHHSPIECRVTWRTPDNSAVQSNLFTIQEYFDYKVKEKLIDMGTWEARAIIEKIQCDDLILNAPFEGVEQPSVNWKFVVKPYRIVSIKRH